jgi:hypothetical protein
MYVCMLVTLLDLRYITVIIFREKSGYEQNYIRFCVKDIQTNTHIDTITSGSVSKTYKQTHKSIKLLPVLCQRHTNKQTNPYYWFRFCVNDIQTNKHIDKITSGSVSKTYKQTNKSILLISVLCQRHTNKHTYGYNYFRFCV